MYSFISRLKQVEKNSLTENLVIIYQKSIILLISLYLNKFFHFLIIFTILVSNEKFQ